MTTGTRKPHVQIGLGILIVCAVALLCWGVGSALIWLYNTHGIWFGTRNT